MMDISFILFPHLGSNGVQCLIDLVKMFRVFDVNDIHQFTEVLVIFQ